MSDINSYLRQELPKLHKSNVHVAPNLPEKKLNNAVKSFKYAGSPDNVVALLDITVFGSGADGILFTGEQLIVKPTFADPIAIKFNEIVKVRFEETNPKFPHVIIVTKEEKIKLENMSTSCSYSELTRILNHVLTQFEDFKEQRQSIPLEEMSEQLKIAYLKIIVNMAYANDQVIDRNELAEIFLLMNRLGLEQQSRFDVRSYLFNQEGLLETKKLFEEMNSNIVEGQHNTVHISLAKDLINIFFSTQSRDLRQFEFFNQNRSLFQINEADISIIIEALEMDYKLLEEDFTDDKMKKAFSELSAKAAAVGTPLAAVYLSGSVIGMSAAGMTSGLAMLGMGGVLGFSSMATGIGVAILIGVGTYAGVKKLTGSDELSKYKRKQLMLNEVIKQTQDTISTIVGDINYVTSRLNQTIEKVSQVSGNANALLEVNAKLRQQMSMLKGITGAADILNHKVHEAEGDSNKLKCPLILDISKLQALTTEPTKKKFYDFIMDFYVEEEVVVEKNNEKQTVKRLVVDNSKKAEFLQLSKAFDVIGYFNVSDVLAGKTKQALTGLFT